MHRRTLLKAAAAVAVPMPQGKALAQSRSTTRILVGSAAGGQSDVFARTLADALQKRTGQTFIVENRTGGGGIVAAQALTSAAPDGNTLLLMTLGHVMVPYLQKKPPYNALSDFAPVAALAKGASLLVVHQNVPVRDLPGFIAYAKANPNKLLYGSAGVGSPQHLSTEYLKSALGIEMLHVPYRGTAPAAMALLSGEVTAMILDLANAEPMLRDGKIRAVAQTGLTPVPGHEALPRIADLSPGFDVGFWMGVVAPKGTPDATLESLNRLIADVAVKELRDRATAAGLQPIAGSRASFAKFIEQEDQVWSAIVKKNGITVD